jgi:hypothetical protein
LQLLAGSAGATAAGSMIISQPAYADSGSETCRFDFTGNPTVTVVAVNQTGGGQDQCTVNVSGVSGICPCGGGATIEYAYFFTIPELGTGGTTWIPSSGVFVTNNPIWPNGGGSVTVGVGVRVTCEINGRTAIRCRFGSVTVTVGRNQTRTGTLTLSSNNGNDPRPTGIPACDPPGAQRSAALFSRQAPGGTVGVVAGFQAPIAVDPTADDPIVDLGPIEPVEATTTTTTAPADPPPSTTAAPATTSTTTTSTTTPSTSSTSTTAPPVID